MTSDGSVGRPGGQAGLLCPNCRVDLVMSERQGVEIDYCPRCRGVWLDRGELDKILERSAAELSSAQPDVQSAPPPLEPRRDDRDRYRQDEHRYQEHKHHEHKHHKHRRRSFLDDLFD